MNRKDEILKLLVKTGEVTVKQLSKKFKISEVSIRKDLTDLENENKLKRVHGGAIPVKNRFDCRDLQKRKTSFQEEKYAIAEKCFNIIENDDVIFMDNSSINILLSEILVAGDKKITVITNMLEVASILSRNLNLRIYVLPGFLDNQADGLLSSSTKEELGKINIDKSFIGCSGFDLAKKNLSTDSFLDGELKRSAIKQSREAFIILEKAKFDSYDLYNFIKADEISNLITVLDDKDSKKSMLIDLGIKVY